MNLATILVCGVHELLLGSIVVLAFQLTLGALYLAGRTIDIQAGFGLALLIDPTSRAQTPLVGTLFAYAAGCVLFVVGGAAALLRLFYAWLHVWPVGALGLTLSVEPLASFASLMFLIGLGVGGGGEVTELEVRRRARATGNGSQVRRLLALAAIYAGGSRGEAARVGGVGLQTVRDWVFGSIAKGRTG